MQTLDTEADWRPGFAKRADNFHAVAQAALGWTCPDQISVQRVASAVLRGAHDLTVAARLVLLHYVWHLNVPMLKEGIACVWPSTTLIAAELDLSESQLRAHRKQLEARGYMVRDYTRANRPAGVEAYDLGPLMSRLAELEDYAAIKKAEVQAAKARQREHVVAQRIMAAQAPESRRLEQSTSKNCNSVQEPDAPKAPNYPGCGREHRGRAANTSAAQPNSPLPRPEAAHRSPRRARSEDGSKPAAPMTAERLKVALRTAAEASPRVAALLPRALFTDPDQARSLDGQALGREAAAVLPNPERNNDQTFAWALSRHGALAFVMLAVAIEDPTVQHQERFFGFLASHPSEAPPDLTSNLERIRRARAPLPCPEKPPTVAATVPELLRAPGDEDPRWVGVRDLLVRALPKEAFGAWFGGVGFHGVVDGELRLSARSGVQAAQITQHYRRIVLEVAQQTGLEASRLSVSVRQRDH